MAVKGEYADDGKKRSAASAWGFRKGWISEFFSRSRERKNMCFEII